MKLDIGEKLTYQFQVTEEMVKKFADLSGDHQLLHVDEAFAKRTIFKKKIAHGLLTMLPLSMMLGEMVPDFGGGEYLIFKKLDNIRFLGPVYSNDLITLELMLKEKIKEGEFLFSAAWRKDEKTILVAEATMVLKVTEDEKNA